MFACAAAESGPGNAAGPRGDGQCFCGCLAPASGARVIAARDPRLYCPRVRQQIDLGRWEGPAFELSNDAPEGVLVPDPGIRLYRTHRVARASG